MGDSEDESTGSGEALGARPAVDPLALEVMRSRISNALFATDERVRIGRYQLLQRAGAGGMGVVWSAWDPELERRVAIKLMHVKNELARAYMLREGQALAKLSHPNIIPIYDVGTFEDQVYLVMEWIAGVTLRAYCAEPRSTREIVAIYLAAGAGVAAAHHAGIVQRDFKPDNVMIGDDGRVRVLDFGLARHGNTTDGGVAGTPKYMAPEQAAGTAAGPAADQYSFGVSLGESLSARGDVPAWVAAIIARATAADPAARYPDMDALRATLARDPARVWRRRAVAGAALLALGGAFAIGATRHEPDVCTGASEVLAEVWTPQRRAALVDHVTTLGTYGATNAGPLAEDLAAYGTRWTAARTGACRAKQRREITEPLYERSLACLERARAALDAVTTTLARTPSEKLPDAVKAARSLPGADRCVAEATTDVVAPPPREIAARVSQIAANATRAQFLAIGADPAATELARTAVRDAAATNYAPVVARANLALGRALEMEVAKASVDAYAKAADAALAGGDDVTFVEAFARRLFVLGRRGDATLVDLLATVPFVSIVAQRTGANGAFARALFYNNVATTKLSAGNQHQAVEWLRRARAEVTAEQMGTELAVILGNLAMVVSDRDERDALFAEERAQLDRTLGADHPLTLSTRLRAANVAEDPRLARARLREVCEKYLQLHPQQAFSVVECHYELGWLAVERGDADEAKRAYTVVAAVKVDDPRIAMAEAEVARLGGDRTTTRAEALAREAEATKIWFARLPAADAWLSVAAVRTGPAAISALEAARAVLVDARAHTNATLVVRRYMRVTALLALAKHDRALAEEAAVWYRTAGGYDDALRALTAE